MIFDTHCHYTSEKYAKDLPQVLEEIRKEGVGRAVTVSTNWKDIEDTLKLTKKEDFLYGTVGFHPDEVGALEEEAQLEKKDDVQEKIGLELLRDYAQEDKIVAIGEIGLDYHWMIEPEEIQQKWFIRQLELAKELDLPVNIHSRDATKDTFDIMKQYHEGTTGGIIHCFSGSVEVAREYVKLGYYLGIGGVVTFKNSKTLKRVVEDIPLSHLVTETDCPYMAPEPYRGRRNQSSYIRYVIRKIAELKGISEEEVERVTWENACRVYRLDNSSTK